MLIQIQSRKISDSYNDDYEYCLLQGCGTLHLPTDLHGSNLCSLNGTSKPNERFEFINIRVATGTQCVIFSHSCTVYHRAIKVFIYQLMHNRVVLKEY